MCVCLCVRVRVRVCSCVCGLVERTDVGLLLLVGDAWLMWSDGQKVQDVGSGDWICKNLLKK